MPEEISLDNQLAKGNAYNGIWIDSKKDLPEEGEPVLVLLEDYSLGFGYLMNGVWEVMLPPWEPAFQGEEDVIYWTKYPRLP